MQSQEIGKQKNKSTLTLIFFIKFHNLSVAKLAKYDSPSVSNCFKGTMSIIKAPKEIGLHEFYICDLNLSNDQKKSQLMVRTFYVKHKITIYKV